MQVGRYRRQDLEQRYLYVRHFKTPLGQGTSRKNQATLKTARVETRP